MNAQCGVRREYTGYDAGIAGLVALVLLAGCSQERSGPGDGGRDADAAVPVRLAEVHAGEVRETLTYAANIKALDEAVVYSRVPGKISAKRVEEGTAVKRGETIMLVDRDEVGLTFEPAPVEAPLSGVVGRIYVDLGAAVSPQTPVALVANIDQVRARVDIPEKYISALNTQLLAEVSVDAWPDQVFTGRVFRISPVFDQDTRTAPLEIVVENPDGRLMPGMFARVEILLKASRQAAVVPREAIMGRGEDTTAYVVQGKTVRLRSVRIGLRRGSRLEVLEGLSQGDMVVVMGQQRLRDGSTVLLETDGAK